MQRYLDPRSSTPSRSVGWCELPSLRAAVRSHRAQPQMSERVQCQFCKGILKHSQALDEHLRDSWCGCDYVCDLCNMAWRDVGDYDAHIAGHVQCQFCQRMLKHSQALDDHLRDSWCGCEYVCDLCNMAWRDAGDYDAHIAAHVQCQFCQRMFKHSKALDDHLRDSWCGCDYVCDLCNMAWRDAGDYDAHIAGHVQCQFCQRQLKHSQALDDHLRDSWCGCDYVCDLCNMAWRDVVDYDAHIAGHVQCQFCQRMFKHSKALDDHLRDSWCGCEYVCDLCNMAWRDAGDYDTHIAGHVQCQFCQRMFKHSQALEDHLRDSWCGCDYVCDLCNMAWRDVVDYDAHIAGHVQCQFCQRQFKHSQALEDHLRDSWCGCEYVCDLCNMAWRDVGDYDAHIAGHVQCQFCHRMFRHSKALDDHLRASWCGCDYVCDLCNMAWRDAGDCDTHIAGHVQCQFCQRIFKHSKALDDHLRGSWCGCDYVCDLCNMAWRDAGDYDAHIAGHVQCQFCQRMFKHSKALDDHLRDSWCGCDYVCDLFNMAWRDVGDYDTHIAGHVQCQFCQRMFKHSKALDDHLRDSHCGQDHIRGAWQDDEASKDLLEQRWAAQPGEELPSLIVHAESLRQRKTSSIYISPMQVHFSHDSISPRFSCGRLLRRTLREILSGQTCVKDLPRMQITKKDGKWWAFTGNRRLWVFRELAEQGAVDQVWMEITTKPLPEHIWTTTQGGRYVYVRGSGQSAGRHVYTSDFGERGGRNVYNSDFGERGGRSVYIRDSGESHQQCPEGNGPSRPVWPSLFGLVEAGRLMLSAGSQLLPTFVSSGPKRRRTG